MAIITVNNTTDPASTSDNGFCTLREAINNANSLGTDTTGGDCAVGTATGIDTIRFSVSGTITLGSNGTLPDIMNLTVDGSGQNITIDGANSDQILSVDLDATLNLGGVTIANGSTCRYRKLEPSDRSGRIG